MSDDDFDPAVIPHMKKAIKDAEAQVERDRRDAKRIEREAIEAAKKLQKASNWPEQ